MALNSEKINTEANPVFEHYMIYVNGRFIKDVYCFSDVQDYYNKYFLYGKITYEKVA